MATSLPRRKFTVDEYHRMAEIGILSEHERIELIDGEMIKVPPMDNQHEACIVRLKQFFSTSFAEKAVVWVRNPIRIGDYSELDPDIAVLKPRSDLYTEYRPQPKDILLIVECIPNTLGYKRGIKLPVYAAAGIQEVWMADVARTTVEIYTQPFKQEYEIYKKVHTGNKICSETFPELNLTVQEILE